MLKFNGYLQAGFLQDVEVSNYTPQQFNLTNKLEAIKSLRI